jgi:hypothetical protein
LIFFQLSPANETAGDFDEGFVNHSQALESNAQASVIVEPTQRSLNNPARLAQSAAMKRHPPSNFGLDSPSVEHPAVFVMIVTAVSLNNTGLAQRTAALAANGGNGLNQGHKLGDIVAVGPREQHGKRDALCLGDQVVLGAGACAISGVGSCF